MKVVIVIDSFYPYNTGGRETWMYNITNRLIERHDICVISQKAKHYDKTDGYFQGIDERVKMIKARSLWNVRFIRPICHSYINYFRLEIDYMSINRKIKEIVKGMKGEEVIIISLNPMYIANYVNKLQKKYHNIIHIVSVRGKVAECWSEYFPLFKRKHFRLENKALRHAQYIWANGFDTQKYLKERGYSSIVMPNGVDTKMSSKVEWNNIFVGSKNVIVSIGTLFDLKGYPEIIEAVAYLKNNFQIETNLFIFGKGNQDKYIKLAAKLDVTENVHFMGEVRNAFIYAKYADINFCGGKSISAGLSMSFLEQMTTNVPVIAWDIDCYTQLIIDKENGYLVPEGNVKELALKMKYVLEHKKEGLACAEKARKTVEQFDWDNIVDKIDNELCKIMKEVKQDE